MPSHWRTVFASAGATKVVSRASIIPCTFHSVKNNGRPGVADALISPLHLCGGATHAIVHRNLFVGAEQIFNGIVGVGVGRNEIDWHMICSSELEKIADPGCSRRCRAPHAQPRTYAL